jgi:hypothetical protein
MGINGSGKKDEMVLCRGYGRIENIPYKFISKAA